MKAQNALPARATLLLLVSALLLCGCESRQPRSWPDTPDSADGPDLRVPLPPADPVLEPDPTVPGGAAAQVPSAERSERQASRTASYALLEQSREAEAEGNRAAAITYLERALRLTPRAADLWIALGHLQLPGAPLAAQRYARKALTLTAPESDDYRQAWLLIADAKEIDGDETSADAIRDRFRTGTG